MVAGMMNVVKKEEPEVPKIPQVSQEDIKMTVFQILQACNLNQKNDEMPVEVKESGLKGGGMGLYATKDIEKGGFITTYPVHFILAYNEEKKGMEFACCNDLFPDVKVAHDELDDYRDYAMGIQKGFTILGCPKFTNDSRLVGHMINDLCYDGTDEYKTENCNCEYHFMDVIANKKIKAGEELSVKYGKDYWFSPQGKDQIPRHEELNKNKDYIILNESGSEESTD
tara:strand:- start:1524 stop:2201 length:678 start_codon:yes stop_codon:yes gene_type:complete